MSPADPLLVAHLLDVAERRAPTCRSWLQLIADAGDVFALETAFADASRRVGTASLALTDTETVALARVGVEWPLAAWCVDDVVRIATLVAAAQRAPDEMERFIVRRRQSGDVRAVLEALVCDNPFPARHFHALHFEELVLAALEAELPLARTSALRRA